MIIDAHVHYTPPELKTRLDELADAEPYWHLLLNPPKGKSIQGWVSAENMIRDMDSAEIDKIVLVGEYFTQHDSCVRRNDEALAIIKRWPDRVLALATLQPFVGDASLHEFQRCLDGGMVGVGELNPYAQGFSLSDPKFIALCELCIQNDVPLNLHVSEEIGGYYVGKSTTPLRHYYDLACRLPDLKLILAHWGGGLLFYEMMPRVQRQLRNVWYDTAATPLLYPVERIFTTALTCIDHRKILYGSDYPLRIYPRTMQEASLQPLLAAVRALNLSTAVEADILGLNAARLFGLMASDEPDYRSEIKPLRRAEPSTPTEITGLMSIQTVLDLWPESAEIFATYHFPTQDSTLPSWEPIHQAAAARGLSIMQQTALLEALNRLLSESHQQ